MRTVIPLVVRILLFSKKLTSSKKVCLKIATIFYALTAVPLHFHFPLNRINEMWYSSLSNSEPHLEIVHYLQRKWDVAAVAKKCASPLTSKASGKKKYLGALQQEFIEMITFSFFQNRSYILQ